MSIIVSHPSHSICCHISHNSICHCISSMSQGATSHNHTSHCISSISHGPYLTQQHVIVSHPYHRIFSTISHTTAYVIVSHPELLHLLLETRQRQRDRLEGTHDCFTLKASIIDLYVHYEHALFIYMSIQCHVCVICKLK